MKARSGHLYAILSGFFMGAVLFGAWLMATEPDVGFFAFAPSVAIGLILAATYAVDTGYFSSLPG